MANLKKMKSKTNAEVVACFDDYKPDESIFTTDTMMMRCLKKAVARLNDTDRTIILMVSELGSQSEVARRLHISPATMSRKLASIRQKVFENMADMASKVSIE